MAGPTPPPRGKAGIALRAAPSASPAKGRMPSRSPSRQPKKEAESQPLPPPKPASKGVLPPVGATLRFTYDKEERVGVVGYAGTTDFAAGEWIGVILDQPSGKNDGSVKEKRYFSCAPQHGLFIRNHMVLEVVKTPGADTEESLSVASTTASGATTFPDGLTTPASSSSDRKQSDEEVETSNLQQSMATSTERGEDVRAGLEAMRIELEARYSGRESELREEAAAGLRSLEVEEVWARDAVTSERQEAAEAKVELADARAETAAALAEADRAWEAVEAAGTRAKKAAQAYEEDLQAQADQSEQLEVLISVLRRGQDSCLQTLDAHWKHWQSELAEAQEACELAEERAAALSTDHTSGYSKDWEDTPARPNDWQQVPITGDEDSNALARLEASAAASLAYAERAMALQAAEAVEARIEDVETEAAASKQALVVMLAEEASASMEANVAEVEEVVEAAHERVMTEVLEAKNKATETAEVRRVSLQREEQAHALTMNQLMVTRQALLDGRQTFEQNAQLQAEEGADLRGRELEEAALAQAASERAVALGEVASACEQRLAELEERVSVSDTATARLEALETEVRQVRRELERREAELSVAAQEALGQRLQIAELGKEVAKQKSENPQSPVDGERDHDRDRDRGILLRRRSENDKDRHTSGGGILDLACCYGGRVRQPQR